MRDTVGYQGKTSSGKGEWITPPKIVSALGFFDLDPCAPVDRVFPTAIEHYTDHGLEREWTGRVFCNPPYDLCREFFEKCALHGNAIALCYNRTETTWFQDIVYGTATAILYKKGRIKFLHADGTPGGNGPGAGSVFVAWGLHNAHKLETCSKTTIEGHFERLR